MKKNVFNGVASMIAIGKCCLICRRNAIMQPEYHVTESLCARDVDPMMSADDAPDRDKPENCGVLSHHSNNKTNVLTTFQVHNLLTGTLLLSTFLLTKSYKNKKNVKTCFFILNLKKKRNYMVLSSRALNLQVSITTWFGPIHRILSK